MALDFGTGVTRTLSPAERAYSAVVWAKGKPPLDSELNLMASIDWERFRLLVKGIMPSGFLLDPTRAIEDFEFSPLWANLFSLGNPKEAFGTKEADETHPLIWANVNGWVIPVTGTDITTEGDVRNFIKLYPPPESDTRVDFVFLEAWQTLVAPNPSISNKPTASTVYKYGNVKFGGTNITDDLEDPTIGFETTERVQVQYRLRVYGSGVGLGAGIALDVYPDGLDDPNVLGQGTSTLPVAGLQYTNMREVLGDPSLWRAGDGDPNNSLGTVDGYTYAIPVCAVFRRNNNVYTAVNTAGNPNQNGAFERTPASKLLADPLQGSRIMLQGSIQAALNATDGVAAATTINITNLNGSGLEDTSLVLTSTFFQIEDEIVGISAISVANEQITIPIGGRGRFGTAVVGHPAAAAISLFNSRPDGAYADEVQATDVLDLRRGVNPGDWDYARILEHNVAALTRGDLRSAWKQSAPGDTEGPVVHEVDYLLANGSVAVPNHTEALDGPDGVRYVWSDGATIQPDVTVMLHNGATKSANGVGLSGPDGFDNLIQWEVAADFNPVGFVNMGSAPTNPDSFSNGSCILLFSGGNDDSSGAKGTFRDGAERAVRFVTPREFWKSGYPTVDPNNGNQYPITLRFINERSHAPIPPTLNDQAVAPDSYLTRHPGPMYPWRESNFERPFLVLGGLLHTNLRVVGLTTAAATLVNRATPVQLEIDVGLDFDAAAGYFSKDANGDFETDVSVIASPLLRGERTLYDMLTCYGKDRTGASSEVYVLLYGDDNNSQNNGAFKVIGAGTAAGYTNKSATNATSIVVEPLSADFTAWDGAVGGFIDSSGAGKTVTVEFRSQHHNAEDTSNFAGRIADLAIVLTDIGGVTEHPWSQANLGTGTAYDVTLGTDVGNGGRVSAASKAVINTTLLYHPGRAAMARVPDEVVRVSVRGGAAATNSGTYLQQNKTQIDTTFAANSGVPIDETPYTPAHVQTWNRLPGKGWQAPFAPNYGGNIVGFTESDRENQAFYDKGSKTLIFRPFRDRSMTLKSNSWTGGTPITLTLSFIGGYNWADLSAKDSLSLWTGGAATGKKMAYEVPPEFMPRFGRQDIPHYVDTLAGAGRFLSGINHLFLDQTDDTEPVFEIIGGEDNVTAGNEVTSLHFVTNEPGTAYGHSGTVPAVANTPFIAARKVPLDIAAAVDAATVRIRGDLAAVDSSDFGRGLKGIQIPPFYGPARIYGVYERANWEAQGGDTFAADRVTPLANPATNLLREDADRQTLFILENGGEDITGELNDHTYIIPTEAIDVARVPGFISGTHTFDSYEYVVECVVFGFAKGFINQNNFVLQRNHSGAGTLRADGVDLEIQSVRMCLPCPAGLNDGLYVAYNRTVYQGDVYMSRAGETRTTSDYENRYGQIDISGQHSLKTAIQQFDANGDFIPETPNARAFQVLASLDFYTTLGTGKIGGDLYPGTPLDVGYTTNSPEAALRSPENLTDPAWRIRTRAFTEGQKRNPNRAAATLEILDNNSLIAANEHGRAFRVRLTQLDNTVLDLYGVTATRANAGAGGMYQAGTGVTASNSFIVDESSLTNYVYYRNAVSNFGTLGPKLQTVVLAPIPKATWDAGAELDVADNILVTVNAEVDHGEVYGGAVFYGRVAANGDLYLTAVWTASYYQFDTLSDDSIQSTVSLNFASLVPGASAILTHVDANVQATDIILVEYPATWVEGLLVHAVAKAGAIDFVGVNNHSAGGDNIDQAAGVFKYIAIRNVDPNWLDKSFAAVALKCSFTQEKGDENVTANNLVALLNTHTELSRTLTAFNDGTSKLTMEAIPTGSEGNGIKIDVIDFDVPVVVDTVPGHPAQLTIQSTLKLATPKDNRRIGDNVTMTRMRGGGDLPVNAGLGSTQLRLAGMTERLPLGALLQDSDFLGENPFGDAASAMQSSPANLRPIQNLLPLTGQGEEFTRFMGAPGELIGMADGSISLSGFLAYTTANPTGSRRFRLFRGGGSAFMLSGTNPGGPLDWVSESFPASQQPVLKGGILSCKALLVRNFYEEGFSAPYTVSEGDEIQLVVITQGILGDWQTTKDGMTLFGLISPAGYGEGMSAADRYRCHGRPMAKGHTRQVPNPSTVTLAVYDEQSRIQQSNDAVALTSKLTEENA